MPANGDSAAVQTHYKLGNIRKMSLAVTFDSGDGSFAATALTDKIEGRLLDLVTNPGSPAPTDDYHVTLVDQHGHDVLEGVGVDRDTSTTEKVPIVYSGTAVHPYVDDSDTLTLTIINNIVHSATTVIEVYYAPGVG